MRDIFLCDLDGLEIIMSLKTGDRNGVDFKVYRMRNY